MNDKIIAATAEHVKALLSGESSGHDWFHVERVWKMGHRIAVEEKADVFVVDCATLLHDISDYKLNGGDDSLGPKLAKEWLQSYHVDASICDHVAEIIQCMSFKGAGTTSPMRTLEGKIVQDADRLDAIGAIGIARTFAFGGAKGRIIYDPAIKPVMHQDFEAYKTAVQPTVNHFYEKLLLLKDRMNTATAKRIAAERHVFMEQFLERLYAEWEGKA